MFKFSKVVGSLCVVALCAVSSFAQAQAKPKEKFIFAWPSAINAGVANLTFARELGYFDQENLEVDVIVLTGSGVIIPQLLSGAVHSAYASLEPLPVSRQPGKPNFPIRFVYNYLPRSIWEIAVLDESPIKTVADLKGKNLGLVSLTAGNVLLTQAMLQKEGVDWTTVSRVAVGSGVPAFEALRRKQVDAINLWDTMHSALAMSGTKIRLLPYTKDFAELSSHGFPVTEELLKTRPDFIARFGRAMSKGAVACQANLEGCIKSFWREYPSLKPTTGSEADNLKREVAIMKPRIDNLMFKRTDTNMGAFESRDWTQVIDALKMGGMITESVNIPLETLYTNQLVPEYNKFNRKEVIEQAKAYK